jgi:tripartite-type tricarboxylate transporter receptor subunit TctC
MKKFVSIVLAALMLVFVVACGNTNTVPSAAPTAASVAPSAPASSAPESVAPAPVFPTDPIKIIVPFNAGGGIDTYARALAEPLSDILGVDVVIENVGGSGGAGGTLQFANAAHDGYTLLANSSAQNIYCVQGLSEYSYHDFDILNISAAIATGIFVKPGSGLEDPVAFKDAIVAGNLKGAAAGSGGGQHLTLEIMAKYFGGSFQLVPYGSGAESLLAVAKGEADFCIATLSDCKSYIEDGTIACTFALTPEAEDIGVAVLPAFTEFFNGDGTDTFMEMCIAWRCVSAMADTPDDVKQILTEAIAEACATDSFKEYVKNANCEMMNIYGDEAAAVSERNASGFCWTLYDIGLATKSPEEFNIPKP